MAKKTRTQLKAFFETGDMPSASNFSDVMDSFPNIIDDGAIIIETPISTATVTIANTTHNLLINPAGTIAALTINFPAGLVDGQDLLITFTHIVTTITTSGANLLFPLTSAALGDKRMYRWSTSLTKWI